MLSGSADLQQLTFEVEAALLYTKQDDLFLKALASASLDGTIYLRRVDTPGSLAKLTNAGGTRSIAFSPDGTQIATGNWNGTVQFWQVWDDGSDTGLASVTPKDAALLPAYPNPFNDGTQLPSGRAR